METATREFEPETLDQRVVKEITEKHDHFFVRKKNRKECGIDM